MRTANRSALSSSLGRASNPQPPEWTRVACFRPLRRNALRMKNGGRAHAGGFARCCAAVAESTWIYSDSSDHTGTRNWSYDGDLYPGAPGYVEVAASNQAG